MNELDPSSTPSPKARILIVDDHPMTREGIVQLIDKESDLMISAQAGTAREAMAAVAAEKPDLVLLDLNLPDKGGIELLKDLKAQDPSIRTLVLSMHEEEIYADRALRAGASGYIMKVEGGKVLLDAIRRVLDGELAVSAEVSKRIVRGYGRTPAGEGRGYVERLSDREMEVFSLLGTGMRTREIGDRLHVSAKTVEAHRSNIKAKLSIDTAAELIAYAARWVAAEGAPK